MKQKGRSEVAKATANSRVCPGMPKAYVYAIKIHISQIYCRNCSACVLCGRADVDPDICGYLCANRGVHAHEFCLKFAMGIDNKGPVTTGIVQHPLSDVRRVVRAAKNKRSEASHGGPLMSLPCAFFQKCFVCGDFGATIHCAKSRCRRRFHLPCATDGECVTEFFGSCRSFCGKHRPQQTSEAAPAQGTNCTICLEPVGDGLSYHTMLCPVCKQAWFHRGCIQRYALSAGITQFKCPVCAEKTAFSMEMITMGLQIPVRPTPASLQEGHRLCDQAVCYCPKVSKEEEVGHNPFASPGPGVRSSAPIHRSCKLNNSLGSKDSRLRASQEAVTVAVHQTNMTNTCIAAGGAQAL
ncbi:hypothetical protein ASZ78_004966 [Callipepla squamata]|uniref:PHD-type domain-containing protein n=1 Tax=Callipepla squamata TaxID=9009 RepID=A0A226N9Q0_CALSU|nr:hypothetical protein ASZ78_004966 [Callipepla squamata]